MNVQKTQIAIIGMGYVGLPLAIEFEKIYQTFGYDSNKQRISELMSGFDSTREIESKDLANLQNLIFSNDIRSIEDCNIYIICVPTPINEQKKPDLSLIIDASSSIGKLLKKMIL